MACDAKLNFDDNAEWRQKDTFKFRDYTQEDTREVKATTSIGHAPNHVADTQALLLLFLSWSSL